MVILPFKSETPLMGVVLEGRGGGGGGAAKESPAPEAADDPRGANPNPSVGVTDPGRGLDNEVEYC